MGVQISALRVVHRIHLYSVCARLSGEVVGQGERYCRTLGHLESWPSEPAAIIPVAITPRSEAPEVRDFNGALVN